MTSCFLREIGVDVTGMETSAARRTSSLPRLDPCERAPSAGASRRPSVQLLSCGAPPPDCQQLRRSASIGGCIRPGSRPGSRAGSRPGSSSACQRQKPLQATNWDLVRSGSSLQVAAQAARVQSAHQLEAPGGKLDGIAAVLFLDVDGVLHPTTIRHPRQQFQKSCMMLLKEVQAKTHATIVLSTAWREHADARKEVADRLFEYGLPPFVSKTPSIARFRRSREILAWVKKYRPATWVAVDDLPLLEENEEMRNHFVQTQPNFGLRNNTADQIVHLFELQRKHLEKEAKENLERGESQHST